MSHNEVTTTVLLPALLVGAASLGGCTEGATDGLESPPTEPRAKSSLEIVAHGECIADGVSLSLPTFADHPPDPGLDVQWTLAKGSPDGCLVGGGAFARLAVAEPGVYTVGASIAGNEDETTWVEVEVEACDEDIPLAEPVCLGSIAVPGGEDLDPEIYGSACACEIGESADSDADGTPDEDDLCPNTVLASASDGCSVAQLVADPEVLTRQLAVDIAALEDELMVIGAEAGLESLVEAAVAMSLARASILEHQVLVGDGEMCAATEQLSAMHEHLATAAESLSSPSEDVRSHAAGVEAPSEEAVGGTVLMLRLHSIAGRAETLLEEVESPLSSMATRCEQIKPNKTWEGVVVDTPDARGVIELDDGRTAVLPDGAVPVAEGMIVALNGDRINKTLLSHSMEVLDGVAIPVDPQMILPCLGLGVAPPIQPFEPGQPADVVHDAAGYKRSFWIDPDALHLEEGARLAARSNGCEEVFGTSYALRIIGHYSAGGPELIANALRPVDEPVPIPFFRGASSTLESLEVALVEQVESNCFPGPCVQTNIAPIGSHPVHRVDRGSACELEFDREIFELDQTAPPVFQRAVLDGYVDNTGFPSLLTNTNAVAKAEGYRAEQQLVGSQLLQWSTHPNVLPIDQGQGVAVYKEPLVSSPMSLAQTGAQPGSPVRWPHVSGQYNSRDYAYSCTVPDLVRDRVADCGAFPALLDSYYALPWSYFQGWVETTQGNLAAPDRSHAIGSQAQFAFDFDLPMTSFILAARPGTVVGVFEDEWRGEPNCLDMLDAGFPMCSTTAIPNVGATPPPGGWGCVPVGNSVWVAHEDGTFGLYVHFNVAGVVVAVGDVVERGDVLGLSGTTGCSTGPHLHFQQTSPSTPNNASEPISFGGYFTPVWPPQPEFRVCMNPPEGTMLLSTLW